MILVRASDFFFFARSASEINCLTVYWFGIGLTIFFAGKKVYYSFKTSSQTSYEMKLQLSSGQSPEIESALAQHRFGYDGSW